ncbi:non-structural maintenance of chromosomes element 3 homolog isoform X2 [Dreissena polymorpha]|uniref:non-structural maintenance of chromosomes element 3 homolog isoform X2 n=1 Tax=Dreissena polymorpha TaxID=45954 RepID=UPI0022641706|nr:non-structural maintenance of chromosomes element 3 homolog isoform X2 [Dreissena polymorpha]
MASNKETLSQKSMSSLEAGERERLINDVVKYLLILDQKKIPIKKADINKHVLKESSKAFPHVIREAAKRLEHLFGISLVELEDKHKGSFILVNNLELDKDSYHLTWSEEEECKQGLLIVVLSIIFMSGNVVTDSQLWSALKKFGVDQDQTHEVFGNVKKLITQEWARQCYLELTTLPNTDPPIVEVRWGQRVHQETTKRKILEYVSKIHGIEDVSHWRSQFADVQKSERAEGDQPTTSSQTT